MAQPPKTMQKVSSSPNQPSGSSTICSEMPGNHTENSAETSVQYHHSRVRLSLPAPCGGQAQHTKGTWLQPISLRTVISRALPGFISAYRMLVPSPVHSLQTGARKDWGNSELNCNESAKISSQRSLKCCHILHVTWAPFQCSGIPCARELSPAQHPQVSSQHLEHLQGVTDSLAPERKARLWPSSSWHDHKAQPFQEGLPLMLSGSCFFPGRLCWVVFQAAAMQDFL